MPDWNQTSPQTEPNVCVFIYFFPSKLQFIITGCECEYMVRFLKSTDRMRFQIPAYWRSFWIQRCEVSNIKWYTIISDRHTMAAHHYCSITKLSRGGAVSTLYVPEITVHQCESVYCLFYTVTTDELMIRWCSPPGDSTEPYCFLTQRLCAKAFDRTSPRTFVWESSGQVLPGWHVLTLFAQGQATDDWLPLICPSESGL